MKRLLFFAIAVLMLISSLNARTRTRSFDIQGAYGDVLEIDVEPLAAQTQDYVQGMPFNIEDSLVQYVAPNDDGTVNQQNGRHIADMSLISNTDFNIYIRAGKLRSVNKMENSDNYAELDYVLTFDYELAYHTSEGAEPSEVSGKIKYETSNASVSQNGAGSNWRVYDIFNASYYTGFIGALNCPIYFQFTQAASAAITAAKEQGIEGYKVLPYGDYTADVYIVLEAAS